MNATTTKTRPMIWVGCLACYNAGRLVGEWINPLDVDGLSTDETRKLIHKGTPQRDCEEVWVFDHECFDGLLKGECSPWVACEVAQFIDQLDTEGIPVRAFAGWISDVHGDVGGKYDADLLAEFQNGYSGRYDDLKDYAWSYLEESGMLAQLPEWAKGYEGAVVEAWLHDRTEGGDLSSVVVDGDCYVFTA